MTPPAGRVLVAPGPKMRSKFFSAADDTIAALMPDVVLVPKGRIDQEWLKLLAQAVDLSQVPLRRAAGRAA